MEKVKYFFKHFGIFFIVGVFLIIYKTINQNFEDKFTTSFEEVVFNYYKSSFSGIITERYIDKENHDYKIILIKKGNTTERFYLDFEKESFFKSFLIRDTIIKKANNNSILVKRNGIELTKRLNFDHHIDREKHHRNLDTIVLNYIKKGRN